MKKTSSIIFFSLFLFSCLQEDKIPENILDKQMMADIVLDLNIADTRSNRKGQNEGEKVWQRDIDMTLIAKKYNLQDTVLKTSYDFYITHPKLFKEVLELAMAKLKVHEDTIKEGSNDSLKNEDTLSVRAH